MPEIRSMGTTLHYGEAGRGSPVVALHGSASSGAQWRSLAGYLGGRHRVLTPDLAGCGRSGLPRGLGDLGDEAAFLAPLIAAAGEPVHLVGHSYGGAVALEIARRMPWAVRSLTLIEPMAFRALAAAEPALAATLEGVAETIAARAASGEREAAAAAFIDYWNGPCAFARSSAPLRAFFLGALERVVGHFAALAAGPDLPLDRIGCPTLAVMGLASRLPAMRATELVAAAIPGARLALLPGAGHMAPLTDPHLVDPLIGAHLAAVPRAAAAAAA